MFDIKLNTDGDLDVSDMGDISLTESIRQAVTIRLRWIHDEWRLGPDLGFNWFEDVFVKNPNIERIKMLIRNEIAQVEGVTNVSVTDAVYDKQKRTATFYFKYDVDEETFREEVTLYG